MKIRLLIFLLLSVAIHGYAQQISLEWIELSGNKVIIHYDLIDNNPNHQYMINLYSSQDKFTNPITKVSGDVGQDVRPGEDKAITWDITRELGVFKGRLTFEIRGRVFIPFVRLQPFDKGETFVRGKTYPLNWTSGNLSGQVNIELYKGQTRIPIENGMANVGKYEWNIPSGLKPGSDYTLRFTNTKDLNDYVVSMPFTIKAKYPLAAKIGLAVTAGAGIAFMLLSGGDTPTTTPDQSLPPNPGKPN